MQEYITEAVVLNLKPHKEHDKIVNLMTRDFGRIEARASGGAKFLSKFSPHLDVLNLVDLRLVRKNRFTIADVTIKNRFPVMRKNLNSFFKGLELIFLVKSLSPLHNPDVALWDFMYHAFHNANINLTEALKIIGFDPKHAICGYCAAHKVSHFHIQGQIFLCEKCCEKAPKNETLCVTANR